MSKSFLNQMNYSRGLRNNNPGNIIYTTIGWEGKLSYAQNKDTNLTTKVVEKHFEQFIDLKHGLRAMMRNIITKINKGQNTLAVFMPSYSPRFQNKTDEYIRFVSQAMALSPLAIIELTRENLMLLTKAIVKMEIGVTEAALITDQDYNEAFAIIGVDIKSKKKAVKAA